MTDEKPIFGAKSERLDRLVSHVLDESEIDEQAAPAGPVDMLAETIGGWIGRYKLLSVLGEGGMGIVYLAQQDHPIRRHVALKIIKPGMDSKRVLARFEAEQQALALMEHPSIARVHDAGLTDGGRPYFVMEHVQGVPITRHCDEHRLTVDERLYLFLHVCEAVQHAHQKGIVHRDLKPSNILVTIQDKSAIPKIIDFGVARAISQPLTERTLFTEQGQLIGTPEYMSPEQADAGNQDIDTRTDIYSLGVVLYELLAGVLPFDPQAFRESGIERIRQILCEEEPKTPSTRLSKTSIEESAESARRRQTDVRTLQRRLQGDLDWITLKAMEKDRARRYATVDAMATDIRHHLTHQPVSAAPPGTLYRAKKFARRHGQALAVSAMTLLLLVGGLLTTILYVRVAKEHALAQSLEHQRRLDDVQMLTGNRRYEEALASIGPLLNSPHVGREARLAHAKVLLERKDLAGAARELEGLLDRQDKIAGQAHLLLANMYYESDPCMPGQPSEYHQLWKDHAERAEQLIAETPDYYFLRAQGTPDVQKSLALLEKALRLNQQHYDSLRERAHIYDAQHDYDQMATEAYGMIVSRQENPQGYLLRATARRELGRFEEALQDYNEAIRLDPDDPEPYDGRRETYMRTQRYELALHDAEKCAELRPEEPSYFYKPFWAYTALGQYDRAEEHYARFLARPAASKGYDPYIPDCNSLRFHMISCKLVFESLRAARPWHGPGQPPVSGPYVWMHEADTLYHQWSRNARCIIPTGYYPSWSPDGTKLAYSQGLSQGSVVAVLDLETGRTELLVSPGTDPAWSPDGRYMAFVKNRWLLPPDHLSHLHMQTWTVASARETARHPAEVWVMDMASRQMRHIAEGYRPHWGRRSHRLYYYHPADNTLYSISVEDSGSRPTPVLPNCASPLPTVSPDERYVADSVYRELRILDLETKAVVATWIVPPILRDPLRVEWSPDGNELSLGSIPGLDMGLWIYDLRTRTASKVLDQGGAMASWSPDRRRLAISLTSLWVEIWLADLKPDRPTIESFDSVQTVQEHSRGLIGKYNHQIEADPALLLTYDLRADCALWMGHENATEYLQEFDRVLTMYDALACVNAAQRILDSPPEARDRLLPLALLLARKAVEEEPDNADYQKTLDAAIKAAAGVGL